MAESVRLRRHGTVAEIVLDRPDAMNALSSEMLRQLAAALRRIAGGPHTRAVVLSSSNTRAFCVGADLKERAAMSDGELVAQRPLLRDAFAALLRLAQPAIAAVGGYAVGGGYELAMSCDVIIADEAATVGLPEVTRGLIPGGGGTQLLRRRAGPGVAAELIYSGRLVGIDEAERRGLIDRRVPPGAARAAALELAAQIAANSPLAVRAAKRAVVLGAVSPIDVGLEIEETAWRRVVLSADRREGIAAFVEKRPPVWPSGSDAL